MHDLAAQTRAELTTAYNAQVERAGIAALKPVTEAQVKTWIETAAAYAGRAARAQAPDGQATG